ncbi:hypothetical protein [Streptomyces sp. NPDC005009]
MSAGKSEDDRFSTATLRGRGAGPDNGEEVETEALFRVVHAHTLAKSGKRRAALAEAEHTRILLTAAPGDEVPFWALAWDPGPS